MDMTRWEVHKKDVKWADWHTALCSSCSLLSRLSFAVFSASFSLLGTWRNQGRVKKFAFFSPQTSRRLNSQKFSETEPLTLIWSFSECCRQTSLKSLRHRVTHEQENTLVVPIKKCIIQRKHIWVYAGFYHLTGIKDGWFMRFLKMKPKQSSW